MPQTIREALSWPQDEVMVKIVTTKEGFRVERLPISHPQTRSKRLTKGDWDKIWHNLDSLSKSGRQNLKLTEFIRKDRESR